MQFAQQMAYDGAAPLGFGYDDVHPLGYAWILARMHFRFVRTPLRNEKVTMETWHKGAGPLFFRRDFRILDQEGAECVLGTSEWIVMDLALRRMVRPEVIGAILPTAAQSEASALPQSAPKVMRPKGVDFALAGTHRVVYSDLDDNGHTNNTRYLQWAMDALDLDYVGEHDVSDVFINFNKEALPGESVELMHAEADGCHYIEGLEGGAQVFITKIMFK